ASSILVGDPINISDGNTYRGVSDISIKGTLGGFDFRRTYVSTDSAWSNGIDSPLSTNVPAPFGSSPTAQGTSLKWWDSWHSLIHAANWSTGGNANLWSLDGQWIQFSNCTGSPCWATNVSTSQSVRDRLQWTGSA